MRFLHCVQTVAVGCAVAAGLVCTNTARADVDENGWVVDWLVFGPLLQSLGPTPGEAEIRRDYLTDGAEFFEATILPEEGLEVVPDFAPGTAASEGFHPILVDGTAFWRPFNTIDPAGDGSIINPLPDTADYNLFYAGGTAVENAMVYAVTYINNATAAPIAARLELGSDDSIVVKLDDCEVFARNIGRGFGAVGEAQDRVDIEIPAGAHRLMVKVFNGVGGFGHRLRLIDTSTDGPANLAYSLDPAEFNVPEVSVVGLGLTHVLTPDRVLGLDKPVTGTITAVKTFADLADSTQVTVTENLIAGMAYVAGSGVPAPSSTTASSLTWTLTVGDLVANGITFDVRFDQAACGGDSTSGCISGTYVVGAGASCTSPISGKACTVAVPLNAIFLGDIIGGGDGTGNKSPDIAGTRIDTGLFLLQTDLVSENNDSNDIDADPFVIVDDPNWPDASDLIDGAFFMPVPTVAINSAGVEYAFRDNDINGASWNHILSNITHDIDKGVGNIRCAGREPFATGIGIHASAGVTFDLSAIRAKFGADKVKTLSMLIGNDGCPNMNPADAGCGNDTLYIIYSTEDAVLEDDTYIFDSDTEQGEQFTRSIPPEASFLTLATGSAGNGICCDHGVFAEARIFSDLPTAVISANPQTGVAPLNVNFSGAGSTAPAGQTISCYQWDFGDGTTGEGAAVAHTYAQRGRYTAKLTVQTNIGLTNSATADVAASFACGSVAPYTSTDIGAPVTPGCGRLEGDCVVVFGSGTEIGGAGDSFQFVHQAQAGDATVTANVTRATFEPALKGRAGIMMRDGTAANAAFAYMQLTAGLGGLKATFTSRATAGANAVNRTTPNVILQPGAAHIRLERLGDQFIGSTSPDGVTFTEFHRVTLAGLPASLAAGFAVTSRDTLLEGKAAEVTFCSSGTAPTTEISCTNGVDDDQDGSTDCDDSDCTGNPACPVVGTTFHRGDADSNNQVQLTDAVRILNFLFQGTGVIGCDDAADSDDNGQIQLTDAVRILNFLFQGTGVIPAPGPTTEPCGVDPTDDGLGCAEYPNC